MWRSLAKLTCNTLPPTTKPLLQVSRNGESMSRPTVHYDPQSDTLYFLVREGEKERFVEVAEGVNVEVDQEGQLLGVEIMNASRFLRTTIGMD
jgi:uncharacterized protein YuzE